MNLNRSDLKNQFVLSRDDDLCPSDWNQLENHGWLLGYHPSLPVIRVNTPTGEQAGWLLGYAVGSDSRIVSESIVLPQDSPARLDDQSLEEFIYAYCGRFAFIFTTDDFARIYLDPAGSLSVLYSEELGIVCSTASAISKNQESSDWDSRLVKNLPDLWYPFGFTPHKSLKRLLPNHYLDLQSFKPVRHWPGPTSLQATGEIKEKIVEICRDITCNITGVIEYGGYINLTAGADTRMILACSRDLIGKVEFFTSLIKRLDTHISKLLVKKFNLNHTFIEVAPTTGAQREERLYLSGFSLDQPSLASNLKHEGILNPDYLQIAGLGGEVGRARWWTKHDTETSPLTGADLLKRMHIPAYEPAIRAAEQWLNDMADYNTFQILDIFYIEQQLGCWAAPNVYQYDYLTVPVIFGFNHRRVFENMLRLPYEYRRRQEIVTDICQTAWPETLDLPINEFTGILKLFSRGKSLAKKVLR